MIGEFAVNTFVALLLGVVVGIERQFRHHVAGLKTNALVSVGSAIYVGLSLLMDHESSPTRVAAQIVSGLGFLGGGVILREGFNVRGLNTAATIWCSGAVGSLSGAGFLPEAAVGTVAILLANLALQPLSRWIDSLQRSSGSAEVPYSVRIEFETERAAVARQAFLEQIAGDATLNLNGITSEQTRPGRTTLVADVTAMGRGDQALENLVARLAVEPEVISVGWQTAAR